MSAEVEPGKFSRGESKNRPWGGNVADKPFPQALHKLAAVRGYETRVEIVEDLGLISYGTVNKWFLGNSLPSPELLGALLVLFESKKPLSADERDELVNPYCADLYERKYSRSFKRSKAAIISSRKLRNKAKSPIGKWIENKCDSAGISISGFAEKFELSESSLTLRNRLSLNSLSRILEQAPVIFNLSDEEITALSEAVALAIEEAFEKGRRFQDSPGGEKLTLIQEAAGFKTYYGEETAKELGGVTRQQVSLLRKKHDFPVLINQQQLDILIAEELKKPDSKLSWKMRRERVLQLWANGF